MAAASPNPMGGTPAIRACPRCGSSVPESAAFCPGCGRAMTAISAPERLAAALAYLTLVPGVVLLYLDPYRNSPFVRFHAWQSIWLWGVFVVVSFAALFLSNLGAAIYFLLFGILASLAMFFLWVVLSFKAWQGERLELPLFGTLAGRMR